MVRLKIKNNGGFSLLEILVGIIVFALCMQGLSMMALATLKANTISVRNTTATLLAQDRIEYVKGMTFDNIDGAQCTEDYDAITGYEQYKRVTQVTTNPSEPNTRTIIVNVYWNSDQQSVVLETIVGNPGA